MIAPIINLNGTAGDVLEAEHRIVVERFNALLTAMAESMPHPRDFQLNKPGEYEEARRHHLYRIRRIEEIRDEMALLWTALADQNQARRKQ